LVDHAVTTLEILKLKKYYRQINFSLEFYENASKHKHEHSELVKSKMYFILPFPCMVSSGSFHLGLSPLLDEEKSGWGKMY